VDDVVNVMLVDGDIVCRRVDDIVDIVVDIVVVGVEVGVVVGIEVVSDEVSVGSTK